MTRQAVRAATAVAVIAVLSATACAGERIIYVTAPTQPNIESTPTAETTTTTATTQPIATPTTTTTADAGPSEAQAVIDAYDEHIDRLVRIMKQLNVLGDKYKQTFDMGRRQAQSEFYSLGVQSDSLLESYRSLPEPNEMAVQTHDAFGEYLMLRNSHWWALYDAFANNNQGAFDAANAFKDQANALRRSYFLHLLFLRASR